MMVPSVSPSILESNPLFASLHTHVVAKLLNPDASTRLSDETETETQASVAAALRGYHLRAAEEELLRSSLRSVAAAAVGSGEGEGKGEAAGDGVPKLSPDLRDLVDRISMVLDEAPSMDLTEDDYGLLAPDIRAFHDDHHHSGEVAGAVSIDLQRRWDLLCRMASTARHACGSPAPSSTKPAANSKRPPDRLPITTTTTITPSTPSTSSDSLSLSALLPPLLPTTPDTDADTEKEKDTDTAVQSALSSLTTTILQHATVHRALLVTTLTHLERTIHGLHARHSKARSAHVSAVASALAKRIQVVYLQSRNRVYSADAQSALANYRRHLAQAVVELQDRRDVLMAVLGEYDHVGWDAGRGGSGSGSGSGGEDAARQRGVMGQVGTRYGEVLREIELVKKEIGKLESGGGGGDGVGKTGREDGMRRHGER